jgi:hypothetical protein
LGVGGEQNKRLRQALPMSDGTTDSWKRIVVNDLTKAIQRFKHVQGGTKEVEMIRCASLDDLSVYPLSQSEGGTPPKPQRPRTPKDTGPKRSKDVPPKKPNGGDPPPEGPSA